MDDSCMNYTVGRILVCVCVAILILHKSKKLPGVGSPCQLNCIL